MCDYCDCRTRPLISQLGEEHAEITAAIDRLRVAVQQGRPLSEPAAHLVALLAPHSRLEEEALYPELPAVDTPSEPLVADLFPAAHQLLDDRAWDRIDARHAAS